MMLRSRMLLISKELPSKYIECEYIENTSTAYINTLFKPNQDTKVEIEIDMGKYVKPYTDTCVFGEDNGWQKQGFGILIRHNNNQTFHLYNNQYRSPINFPTNISYKGKHILGKNKNDYYIDNVKIHTIEYNTFASPVPIHLLALGRPNNSIEAPAHCGTLAKIYNCRIWDNGILVRDYIPCYNKVSGLYGLYDKLNKEFYTSPNNVKFSGKIKLKIPNNYIKCNYIENTSTAYINTEFKPTSKTKVECEYEGITNNVNNWGAVFGSRSAGFNSAFCVLVHKDAPNNLISAYGNLSNNDKYQYTTNIKFLERHRILFDCNVNTIDNNVYTHTPSNFTSDEDVLIFGLNEMGSNAYFAKMRLFEFKIHDNNIIKHYYIPCIDKYTKDYGLYDLIDGKFYTSPNNVKFSGA